MKKIILLFVLFYSLQSSAQITIKASDMPTVGDTLRYSIGQMDANFLSNYKKSGSNQVWNFSSIKSLQQDVEENLSASQTPYSFPGTIAKKLADTLKLGDAVFTDVFEFYDSSSTEFSLVGRGLSYYMNFKISFDIPFTNPDEVYQFPLDYQDRDSNDFVAKFSINFPYKVFYQSKGYRINNVDAYGQISTPYGTFDALRVVTDIVQTDTLSYDTIQTKINTHRREYKWLAKDIKYPVLLLSGTVSSGNFMPLSFTYRDSMLTSSIENENYNSINISVQPNPVTSNEIKLVKGDDVNQVIDIELLNISGKSLLKKNIAHLSGSKSITIPLPEYLSNGIYFIRFNAAGRIVSKKVILNR